MGRCEPCKNLKAEVGVLRRCFQLRRRSWIRGPASAEVWATAQDRVEPRSRSRAPIDTTPLPKQDAHTTVQAHADSHNAGYVNRFGRGLQAPARFRFSSTVDPPGRITRFVGKQYPVASDFEAISSPLERQFSSSSLHPAARRTPVRKRAPHRRLPASGGPKNPLRRQVPLLLGSVSVPPCGALTSTAASTSPATNG